MGRTVNNEWRIKSGNTLVPFFPFPMREREREKRLEIKIKKEKERRIEALEKLKKIWKLEESHVHGSKILVWPSL